MDAERVGKLNKWRPNVLLAAYCSLFPAYCGQFQRDGERDAPMDRVPLDRQCPKCSQHTFVSCSARLLHHTVTPLGNPVQREQRYACTNCGKEEIKRSSSFYMSQPSGHPARLSEAREEGTRSQTEPMRAHLWSLDNDKIASVQYEAVRLTDTGEVLPVEEGQIQDATAVDRHGDPDLMATLAENYLSGYRAVMPTGRFPRSVVELLPALHLLYTAAELVMKADLIRSDSERKPDEKHSLIRLFERLDEAHRKDTEDRFSRCEPNARLLTAGCPTATITDVLTKYGQSYGGASSVYLDTRYYAEPTTMLRKPARPPALHVGSSLLKSQTPYPIFFPHVVECLLETFRVFDGAERLKRRGADVAFGTRKVVKDNHGDWGLVPRSLGLVVVQVPHNSWSDSRGKELPKFARWKSRRRPGYCTSWQYGGNMLLFYLADTNTPCDSKRVIDGIECGLWLNERLGQHSRDLYLLADKIESEHGWSTLRL